jgi:hypothetical protein
VSAATTAARISGATPTELSLRSSMRAALEESMVTVSAIHLVAATSSISPRRTASTWSRRSRTRTPTKPGAVTGRTPDGV